MSRKIYNRLSFMAVSWLDESTLGRVRTVAAIGLLMGDTTFLSPPLARRLTSGRFQREGVSSGRGTANLCS